MSHYVLKGLIGLCFVLLVGCQNLATATEQVFSAGSSDKSLTTSVNWALVNNSDLATLKIHVETQNSNVILSGYVKTIRQSDTAAQIAAQVKGVKTVQNELVVRK